MSGEEDLEEAMVATVVTGLLIRAGGRVSFTNEEWTAAIDRASTLYMHRDGPGEDVLVVLMPKKTGDSLIEVMAPTRYINEH